MDDQKSETFEVSSGAVVACDMMRGLGGNDPIKARNGKWRAYATMEHAGWGCRVAVLTAVHEAVVSGGAWVGPVVDACIDSASAGIFDDGAYCNADITTEKWSAECREARDEHQFGLTETIPGVVSWAGYGDGSYPVYVIPDEDGAAVAVRIVFIERGEECDYYKIMREGE